MGRPRTWDSIRIEKDYVTSNLSLREIARRNGISHSSLAKHARDNDWEGKRIAYKAALSRRGYEAMAAEIASQEGIIREESLIVMRATLRKYAEALAAGNVAITTKDAVEAIKTIAFLMGEPKDGRQNDAADARPVNKPDAEHLRRIAEAARRQLAGPSVLGRPAAEGEPRARPN
jgi:AcrR family transcriptional regulator